MTRVAREELDQLGDDIDECNVMYLPQVHSVRVIALKCTTAFLCYIYTLSFSLVHYVFNELGT